MPTTVANSFPTIHERILRSATQSTLAGWDKIAFHAMGTICRLQFQAPNPTSANAYRAEVLAWVAQFEAKYSRFLSDSLISRINAAAGAHWVEIDPETAMLLQLCGEMVFLSRGAFDPTALPLIKLWNWKANPPVIPTEAQLRDTRELCGWSKVQRRPGAIFLPRAGMSLDLGGIGKEYAVDRVMHSGGKSWHRQCAGGFWPGSLHARRAARASPPGTSVSRIPRTRASAGRAWPLRIGRWQPPAITSATSPSTAVAMATSLIRAQVIRWTMAVAPSRSSRRLARSRDAFDHRFHFRPDGGLEPHRHTIWALMGASPPTTPDTKPENSMNMSLIKKSLFVGAFALTRLRHAPPSRVEKHSKSATHCPT